jgi:OPA family glycerol-3-phosphate transporter-like MFS transporter
MAENGLVSNSGFRRAQWRILLATMFCYLFYYTGRHTFGFAASGIEHEFSLTKTQIGWFGAVLLWCYAIGQAVNGNLADKFGGRRMMSLGALISCGLNWFVSFGSSFTRLLIPWGANGFAQSMGWAPGSRVLSNWWSHTERGKVYGLYTFAAGMSSILAFVTSIVVVRYGLDWRWIFRLPVLLLLVGGAVYYLAVRDRPKDLGFSEIPPDDDPATLPSPSTQEQENHTAETSIHRYRAALSNGRFLLACIVIGFQSVSRYGLIFWVPIHILGRDWKQSAGTAWISVALPVGMAAGALTSGYISDRLFNAKRSPVIALFLTLAAAASLSMYAIPRDHWLGIFILFLCGFFVYGPQSTLWALCPDLMGRQRAGTATGVMNTFAYAFAGCGEPLIGYVIETFNDNTALVFPMVAGCCLLGAILAIFIRR